MMMMRRKSGVREARAGRETPPIIHPSHPKDDDVDRLRLMF